MKYLIGILFFIIHLNCFGQTRTISLAQYGKDSIRLKFSYGDPREIPGLLLTDRTITLDGKVYDWYIFNRTIFFELNDTLWAEDFYPPDNLSKGVNFIPLSEKNEFPYKLTKEKRELLNFEDFILIQGGYTRNSFYGCDSLFINDYYLYDHPVTVKEYKSFCNQVLTDSSEEFEYVYADDVTPNNKVLNDTLLISGEKVLFSKYWTEIEYENFPMVNISFFQAKLYCQWLESVIKAGIKDSQLKKFLTIRLPTVEEFFFMDTNQTQSLNLWTLDQKDFHDNKGEFVISPFTSFHYTHPAHRKRVATSYTNEIEYEFSDSTNINIGFIPVISIFDPEMYYKTFKSCPSNQYFTRKRY